MECREDEDEEDKMMKITKSACVYCKDEMECEFEIPEGYQPGMSICIDCIKTRHLENMNDGKTILINPTTDPHEFQLWSDLTRRDAEKFRGCQCNWCTKKSIARIRRYNMDGDLRDVRIIAACAKHLKKLRRIVDVLR